ncbi:hypothetical protein APHAL10511_007578 [Amanita phalloides]|nr:hypothetical protein APHAL10511_007578 [Amanita phalloides]
MDLDSPWAVDEVDLSVVRENEWSKIASNFTNAGYREGITAGKESALQEGFDAGFARVGVPLGRELGILRGVTSALVGFLASSESPLLADARDISAQLTNIRLSDIAPPDLEAKAHAQEHLGQEDEEGITAPAELKEKWDMEKLEDMLADMTSNGDKATTSPRPTMEDVKKLKDRLYALCGMIGANTTDMLNAQQVFEGLSV